MCVIGLHVFSYITNTVLLYSLLMLCLSYPVHQSLHTTSQCVPITDGLSPPAAGAPGAAMAASGVIHNGLMQDSCWGISYPCGAFRCFRKGISSFYRLLPSRKTKQTKNQKNVFGKVELGLARVPT